MPDFSFDASEFAAQYALASMEGKAGNAGQEALLGNLQVDCTCTVTVYIAGSQVDTEAEGEIEFYSSHPEAIEIILAEAKEKFDEFIDKMSSTSFLAYMGFDLIETLRQDYIEQAFDSL